MVPDSSKEAKMNANECDNDDRKWSKPVMEKRRRERINRSLEELKRLVLEAQHRDSSRYTKLEKADILEMTVKHLQALRNQQKTAIPLSSPPLLTNYHAGCNSCVTEVTQYMATNQSSVTDPLSRITGFCGFIQNTGVSRNGMEPGKMCSQRQAIPYPADLTETNTRLFPSITSQANVQPPRIAPPFICHTQARDIIPNDAAVPVGFLPVYSNDATAIHGVPQALFQAGHPVGFQVRDSLWRPF